MTNIEIDTDFTDGAPFYHVYAGQYAAQPAYIALYDNGQVTADYSGELDNVVPFDVWHNRTCRAPINPSVSGRALRDYMKSDEFRAFVERYYAGFDVKWDGDNNVGILTPDAENAVIELGDALSGLRDCIIYDADEYVHNSDFSLSVLLTAGSVTAVSDAMMDDLRMSDEFAINGSLADAVAYVAAQLIQRKQRQNKMHAGDELTYRLILCGHIVRCYDANKYDYLIDDIHEEINDNAMRD